MTRTDRGSLMLAGLAAVTLILGVVCGVALDRWVLRPGHRGGRFAFDGGPGHRFDAARYRTQFTERLARDLELTADQRAKVETLFTRQQEDARAVMREIRPRLDQVTARTQDELQVILTPAQLRRWDELKRERR
jgi:hypothetical protein